ncbi:MAG: transposase [Halofilum sp. (in: g-proteobacteria)]|nr:transposase [Halofilum sp. (in: g-proteobacteria)]
MGYGDLRKGRHSAPGQEYLLTTVCTRRQPLFENRHNAETLIDELRHLQAHGYIEWLAWVLMPDHLHALGSLTGTLPLSGLMQRLKGRSSRALGGSVWQPGFHDHALRAEEDRAAIARYMVANPVRAGLVSSLRDYPYWYCQWFRTGDDPDELLWAKHDQPR